MIAWAPIEAELRRSLSKPGVAPHEVDDLVQEAAERLVRALPKLRDTDRLGPYLGRVVRSVWVDHLRARRPTEAPGELPAPTPEAFDLAPEVASWLPALIETLPEADRDILRLVELEGVSQKEAAQRLGLSSSGARTRVQRGRRRIREMVEACCEIAVDSRGRPIDYTPRANRCDCG